MLQSNLNFILKNLTLTLLKYLLRQKIRLNMLLTKQITKNNLWLLLQNLLKLMTLNSKIFSQKSVIHLLEAKMAQALEKLLTFLVLIKLPQDRSEERRVGKECRSR